MPPKFKLLPAPFNLGQHMQMKKKKKNRIKKTKKPNVQKDPKKIKTSSVV
jgi:hypothetical protein